MYKSKNELVKKVTNNFKLNKEEETNETTNLVEPMKIMGVLDDLDTLNSASNYKNVLNSTLPIYRSNYADNMLLTFTNMTTPYFEVLYNILNDTPIIDENDEQSILTLPDMMQSLYQERVRYAIRNIFMNTTSILRSGLSNVMDTYYMGFIIPSSYEYIYDQLPIDQLYFMYTTDDSIMEHVSNAIRSCIYNDMIYHGLGRHFNEKYLNDKIIEFYNSLDQKLSQSIYYTLISLQNEALIISKYLIKVVKGNKER